MNPLFEGIKDQQVSVNVSSSNWNGGCNGCTSFNTIKGMVPHRVWIIDLRGTSFRLCDECKKLLVAQLNYETNS